MEENSFKQFLAVAAAVAIFISLTLLATILFGKRTLFNNIASYRNSPQAEVNILQNTPPVSTLENTTNGNVQIFAPAPAPSTTTQESTDLKTPAPSTLQTKTPSAPPIQPIDQTNESNSLGMRLKIPKIGVNGAVSPVGLTADGAMGPPVGPNGLGWFELGPYPGAVGSAVIDGHFGTWKNGQGSIFDNLYTLQKGDLVYVENADGSSTAFVVRELRTLLPDADTSDIFFSTDGLAHLNLITCHGTWVKQEKTYTERLVVFTDKQ